MAQLLVSIYIYWTVSMLITPVGCVKWIVVHVVGAAFVWEWRSIRS